MSDVHQLPNAIEAEMSVLSSMMQDATGYFLDRATEQGITAESFYLPSHSLLFRELTGCREKSHPFELVTVAQSLLDRGILEQIGGSAGLSEIFTAAGSTGYFDHHLRVVLVKSIQRNAVSALSGALSALYAAEVCDVEAEVHSAATGLAGLLAGFSTDSGDYSAKELMKMFLDHVTACSEGRNAEVIPTPWHNLNAILAGGIGVGEITFVAARPSMGKTAFALDLLAHAASQGHQGQFVSIESGEMKIANRLAASRGAGDVSALSRGNVTNGELAGIRRAIVDIANLPLRVRKLHGPNSAQVASAVRKAAREHGAKVVAIDYLQIIRASGRAEQADVRLRMDNALDALCPLASELGIALVILAQLNREAEGKPGKDLNLSMLKETSRIEQDADTVLMIGEAHDHQGEGMDREPRVIHVPKNRDGATSFARMQFHGPTTTFHSHH